MTIPRHDHMCSVTKLANGKEVIVAAGGRDATETQLASVEIYNISGNTWQMAASEMPDPRYAGVMLSVRGVLYLFGGEVNEPSRWV